MTRVIFEEVFKSVLYLRQSVRFKYKIFVFFLTFNVFSDNVIFVCKATHEQIQNITFYILYAHPPDLRRNEYMQNVYKFMVYFVE